MRLGLLLYGTLAHLSGGFIYDRNLAANLGRQGDRVEVVSLPWRSYARGLLDNLGGGPGGGLLSRLAEAPFDVLLQDELAHPSLFHLNRRLRRRARYPIVAIVHHLRSRENHPAWQKRLYRLVERRYLASVDGYVCVSRTTRTDVESLVGNGRPAVVAPPGKDGLPGELSREEVLARAAAPGPLKILFVGNLIPRKELHTLLSAVASLPAGTWTLQAAGSLSANPAYVRDIRRRLDAAGLGSRVSLLGILSPGDLASRMRDSHLLAVPSSYEGFGIAYLEGMRFGLPAIAGDRGAAGELIDHGTSGFLVPPGNPEALARCLQILLGDRERLAAMGLAAYHSAARRATWSESAARVREFLHRLKA